MSDDITHVPEPPGGWKARASDVHVDRSPTWVRQLRVQLGHGLPDAAALVLATLRDGSQDVTTRLWCAKLCMEYAAPKPREPADGDRTSAKLIELQGDRDRMLSTARRVVEALANFPEARDKVLDALKRGGEHGQTTDTAVITPTRRE